MRVVRCVLRRIGMPLREAQKTSYGVLERREVIVVAVETDSGCVGVSECVAMRAPTYTEETVETAWSILERYLVPALADVEIRSREDLLALPESFGWVRGNRMAIAAVEMALWDAWSAESGTPLVELLGAVPRDVPSGISIGMIADVHALQERCCRSVEDGFQRIKLKIAPGYDYEPLKAIRAVLPDVPLMADANSAYILGDVDVLRNLDELSLTMLEQPFASDDFLHHAALQKVLSTPICLDESIRSRRDAELAAHVGAGRVINLKPGRVGGFAESIRIHDFAERVGIGLWCGGMYETGIGRLHNIALASLPGFVYETDTGPSDRYFVCDIIEPKVSFSSPGILRSDRICGVAERIDWERLESYTLDKTLFDI